MEGVIHDVHLSNDVPSDDLGAWRGRAWADTVADAGGDKVRRMIEDARTRGVSAFRLVNQIFPGGLELPIEYTAVRLGRKGGLVAVGKNLQALADLQSRLIAAQQAMERDYWKLRDVETRYRLVFDTSTEPFLLVRASNLHIVEANPAAVRTLGFSPAGREFLAELPLAERDPFEAMLSRVREQGKAPAVLVHLGRNKEPWLIRATLMTAEPGHAYMLQLAKVGALPPAPDQKQPISSDYLFEAAADGMIVTDKNGVIHRANPAFLDLVQVGSEGSVVGESLGRWLERPGADETVLLANVRKYGLVRLFSTTILGNLGIRTEVEISAAGSMEDESRPIVMVLRNVGQRLPEANAGERLSATVGTLIDQVGKTKLRQLVKDTVGAVERHYVEAALELTDLVTRDYDFADKDEARDYFTRLIGLYKNFNYARPDSPDYARLLEEIDALSASKRGMAA
jgi:transcriptional regulator PpsR